MQAKDKAHFISTWKSHVAETGALMLSVSLSDVEYLEINAALRDAIASMDAVIDRVAVKAYPNE